VARATSFSLFFCFTASGACWFSFLCYFSRIVTYHPLHSIRNSCFHPSLHWDFPLLFFFWILVCPFSFFLVDSFKDTTDFLAVQLVAKSCSPLSGLIRHFFFLFFRGGPFHRIFFTEIGRPFGERVAALPARGLLPVSFGPPRLTPNYIAVRLFFVFLGQRTRRFRSQLVASDISPPDPCLLCSFSLRPPHASGKYVWRFPTSHNFLSCFMVAIILAPALLFLPFPPLPGPDLTVPSSGQSSLD